MTLVRSRDRGAIRSRGGGGGLPAITDISQVFPRYSGAWYSAYDGSFMTVNSDGTGGSPAVGGTVGRLTDRSGASRHIIQATSTKQPTRQTGYLAFASIIGATFRPFLLIAAGMGGTSRSMTGMLVMDIMGIPDSNIPLDFDASNSGNAFELTGSTSISTGLFRFINNAAFVSTGLIWPSQRLCIAWRGSASAFELWVNGAQYTSAALVSIALGQIELGSGGGGFPTKSRFFELICTNTPMSNGDFSFVRSYGATQAGYGSNDGTVLAAIGDSMTGGVGSATVSPWLERTTQMPNAIKYNVGREGATIQSAAPSAAQINTAYYSAGNRCMAVVWYGTNDINGNAQTGALTATRFLTFCAALKTQGWKVVACTLQDFPNASVERLAFNSAVSSGAAGNYDALADLAAQAELSDHTNATYYTSDGVHLVDAGHAIVNTVVSAAIASIP